MNRQKLFSKIQITRPHGLDIRAAGNSYWHNSPFFCRDARNILFRKILSIHLDIRTTRNSYWHNCHFLCRDAKTDDFVDESSFRNRYLCRNAKRRVLARPRTNKPTSQMFTQTFDPLEFRTGVTLICCLGMSVVLRSSTIERNGICASTKPEEYPNTSTWYQYPLVDNVQQAGIAVFSCSLPPSIAGVNSLRSVPQARSLTTTPIHSSTLYRINTLALRSRPS